MAMLAQAPKASIKAKHTGRAGRATPAGRRPVMVVRAQSTSAASGRPQFADSIGLPTEEGVFGFRPFAETWCGRLAMFGFAASIVGEATGKGGTLSQVGLEPSPELLTGLLATLGVALTVGTASTAAKLVQRKMTPKDMARYRNFLGLNNGNDWEAAAREMKAKGDFTTPGDNLAAIAAAKADGAPVDAFLSTSEVAEGSAAAAEMKAGDGGRLLTISKADEAAQAAAAAAEMKAGPRAAGPSVSLAAREDLLEEAMFSGSYEIKYARQVEISNGRAAMVGFLAAVLVEAGTGYGILGQVIMWLKFTGFLGAASGF